MVCKQIITGAKSLKIHSGLRYHSKCFKCAVCGELGSVCVCVCVCVCSRQPSLPIGVFLKNQTSHRIGDQLLCIDHCSVCLSAKGREGEGGGREEWRWNRTGITVVFASCRATIMQLSTPEKCQRDTLTFPLHIPHNHTLTHHTVTRCTPIPHKYTVTCHTVPVTVITPHKHTLTVAMCTPLKHTLTMATPHKHTLVE